MNPSGPKGFGVSISLGLIDEKKKNIKAAKPYTNILAMMSPGLVFDPLCFSFRFWASDTQPKW